MNAAFGHLVARFDLGPRQSLQYTDVPLTQAPIQHQRNTPITSKDPGRLEDYYRVLETVDPAEVQKAVNRIAPRPTQRLAAMIAAFRRDRILWDYLEDAKLLVRVNQVMRRVRLAPLPDDFAALLPAARELVARRKEELLDEILV